MNAPWQSTRPIGVLGSGSAVPGDPMTTEALIALIVDRFGFAGARTAHAVADRLGIVTRHVCRAFDAPVEEARPGHGNAELAAEAVRRALDDAGVAIGEVGYLVAHTTTPGRLLPGNVAEVADLIGYAGPHVELRQACTGFANAVMIAAGLLAADGARPVVVVGSETGSLFFDPRVLADESSQLVNMVQMGDGAAAVVLGDPAQARATIRAAWFGAIGQGRAPGISLAQGARQFEHDFATIRTTGHALFEKGAETAASLDHPIALADWVIPHQVSGRIGALVADHFGLDPARLFVNADRLGNTGSAAIWLALDALRRGPIRAGETAVVLGAEASKHMYGGFAYVHG